MSMLAVGGGLFATGFGIAFLTTGSTACGVIAGASTAVALLGACGAWQSGQ